MKQKPVTVSQPDKKRQHRTNPIVANLASDLSEVPGMQFRAVDKGFTENIAAQLGNGQMQIAQRQAIATEIGHLQGSQYLQRTIGPLRSNPGSEPHDLSVQRWSNRTTSSSNERQIAQSIATDMRNGGITVAVYAYHTVRKGFREFRAQANQFARDHQAIGLDANNAPRIGMAMEMLGTVGNIVGELVRAISNLLRRHPDLSGGEQADIKIKRLAIFTHGRQQSLQADVGGAWLMLSKVEPWVRSIAPYLSPSPQLILYACSTAGGAPRRTPFALAVQEALTTTLESQYGPDVEVAPQVWGHTTARHTTANQTTAGFFPGQAVDLLSLTGNRLVDSAITRLGEGISLTHAQRTHANAKGYEAMDRLLRARHGREDPTNIYIREIPQLGVDRVWNEVSTNAAPDYSDLDLTPQAAARMTQGLREFQSRFPRELTNMEQYIRELTGVQTGPTTEIPAYSPPEHVVVPEEGSEPESETSSSRQPSETGDRPNAPRSATPVSLTRVVEANARWGSRLGWLTQIDNILRYFQYLGYLSPLQTPSAEEFARAVVKYQSQYPRLSDDGILGPQTWRQLRTDIGGGTPQQLAGQSAAEGLMEGEDAYQYSLRITGQFESGGDYGGVQIVDKGVISYGKYQNTLTSGNLYRALQEWISQGASRTEAPNAWEIIQNRLSVGAQAFQRNHGLAEDPDFINALREAGGTPSMQAAQDNYHRRRFFEPAARLALAQGIQSPIGIAIFVDTRTQGGLGTCIQHMNGANAEQMGERAYLHEFLNVRARYLLRLAARNRLKAQEERNQGNEAHARRLETTASMLERAPQRRLEPLRRRVDSELQ